MRELSVAFAAISTRSREIKQHLKGAEEYVESAKSELVKGSALIETTYAILGWSFIISFFIILRLSFPSMSGKGFKMASVLYSGLFFWIGIGVLLFVCIRIDRKYVSPVRTARNKKIEYELKNDPLYIRGKQILEEVKHFLAKCRKYRLYYGAVIEGLQEEDEQLATANYDDLNGQRIVLAKAIGQFMDDAGILVDEKDQSIQLSPYPPPKLTEPYDLDSDALRQRLFPS